jgi:hypothetical protein
MTQILYKQGPEEQLPTDLSKKSKKIGSQIINNS